MQILRSILALAAFAAVAILATDPASARDRDRYDHDRYEDRYDDHDRGNFGIYLGPDSFGLFITNNHRPWHWRGRGYHPSRYDHFYRRDYRGRDWAYGHWYGDRRHFRWDDRRHYYRARDCHPVTKIGFHDGYRVRIGATMCYDRRGNSYIVRGSRRILGYY